MHEPSVKEGAFSCPHCGAYATQHWHHAYVKYLGDDPRVPFIPNEEFEKRIKAETKMEEKIRSAWIDWSTKMRSKLLFLDKNASYTDTTVLNNLFLSRCYNCKKWSVWVNEDMVYPRHQFGSMPNQDLPQNILAAVEEARVILDASPKGAAALLRLCIQMLCKHLGESGENLNEAIANLVKKGLNPVVAKSLDIVRVIGNESVHPGFIDLNDTRDSAIRLFDLVNIIAEQMITHPKHVEELYGKLPELKRKAIEARDANALRKKDR